MFIRAIISDDVENFYRMMCQLDEETEYMMYEPYFTYSIYYYRNSSGISSVGNRKQIF